MQFDDTYTDDGMAQQTEAPYAPKIGAEQVRKLDLILGKYIAARTTVNARIREAERWWRMRNYEIEGGSSNVVAQAQIKSNSAWLHNLLASKHADAMDAYPEASFLPREQGDKQEAQNLTDIIPCVMDQERFERVYSDVQWQKLKTGTGIYKVVWDQSRHNGLGDIVTTRVSLLNVYSEPGVEDIQKSRYVFHTELVDKDILSKQYPQLESKLTGTGRYVAQLYGDDLVSTEDKATVIDCYYKAARPGGGNILHYVKFVGDEVLFATENDPEMAERGLYDHGLYPYVPDVLFPVEGSVSGYGYVDIEKSPQQVIDMLNTCFVQNAVSGSVPRYFIREDANISDSDFLDISKHIIRVSGNLSSDSVMPVGHNQLDGNYVSYMASVIQELRETSGNTETSNGVNSHALAASAISALQEASGKTSRDATKASYRAYADVVNLHIELIRQFYELPRQFRITGRLGDESYVSYSNAGMQPQPIDQIAGQDMGYRKPEFDIKVVPQRRNAYTRAAQNELAVQLFQMGVFNPQLTDQSLMMLGMMEFDCKDEIMQQIAKNGTIADKLAQYQQLALQLAAVAAPDMVQGLSQDIMQSYGVQAPAASAAPASLPGDGKNSGDDTRTAKARERAATAAMPGEGGK